MKRLAIVVILFVSQFFRLFQLRACRFHPTCSTYSVQAFRNFSFFKAFYCMTKRIFRCHPFSAGGFDPLEIPR